MSEIINRMCELLEQYPDDGEPYVWFGFEMNQYDLAALILTGDDRVVVDDDDSRVIFSNKRIWINNELEEVMPNIGVMQGTVRKKRWER